jgi:hypothetical protein
MLGRLRYPYAMSLFAEIVAWPNLLAAYRQAARG